MPVFGGGSHWEPDVGDLIVVVPKPDDRLYDRAADFAIRLAQAPERTSFRWDGLEVPCSSQGVLGISVGIWPSYEEWPRPLGTTGQWRPVSVLVLLGDALGWVALARVRAVK